MPFNICSRNGQIIPLEQATLPVTNVELSYGFGVYENLAIRNGTLFFLAPHLDRLLLSAEAIGLSHPFAKDHLEKFVLDLTGRITESSYNLKILLIGAKEPSKVELFILPLAPLFPDKRLYKTGAHAITTPYERLFPQAKTLNMLGSYLAYRSAKEANAYDALLIDHHGHITEGTRTNFFCIQGTTLISPPVHTVLPGITSQAMLKTAQKHGFSVQERPIALLDLAAFDGAFLTSTSSKIMPLRSIDACWSCPALPPALLLLMKHFDVSLNGCGGAMERC